MPNNMGGKIKSNRTTGNKSKLNDVLSHHLRAAIIAISGGIIILLIVGMTWESFAVFFIFSTGRVGEYFDLKRKLERLVG